MADPYADKTVENHQSIKLIFFFWGGGGGSIHHDNIISKSYIKGNDNPPFFVILGMLLHVEL